MIGHLGACKQEIVPQEQKDEPLGEVPEAKETNKKTTLITANKTLLNAL